MDIEFKKGRGGGKVQECVRNIVHKVFFRVTKDDVTKAEPP